MAMAAWIFCYTVIGTRLDHVKVRFHMLVHSTSQPGYPRPPTFTSFTKDHSLGTFSGDASEAPVPGLVLGHGVTWLTPCSEDGFWRLLWQSLGSAGRGAGANVDRKSSVRAQSKQMAGLLGA